MSPFISLPSATTLPYTYKPIPSKLPLSSTADVNGLEREKYVLSESGHEAHPDDLVARCHALEAHIRKLQEDSERMLAEWQRRIKEEELAEKRRLAPGWLDRDEKILEPERSGKYTGAPAPGHSQDQSVNIMDWQNDDRQEAEAEAFTAAAGDELDRAFGGMVLGRG